MVRYALWAGDDASSNPAYLIHVGIMVLLSLLLLTLNRGGIRNPVIHHKGQGQPLKGLTDK